MSIILTRPQPNIVMPDAAWIGRTANGPKVEFDDTNNYLEITGCNVIIGGTAPSQALDLVGALKLQDTTTSITGVVYKGSDRFIHNFHHPIGGGAIPDGQNTCIGINAGNLTMGATATEVFHASYNTFVGVNAGNANTTGYYNTFVGLNVGYYNTTGNSNTFVGVSAGNANTTGYSNTFVGVSAGYYNTTGYENTFVGRNAGNANTTGSYNTFVGRNAGNANTTGYENTFVGRSAGNANTTGYYNTFVGLNVGLYNTTGNSNTFHGNAAGYNPDNDLAQYRITTDTNVVLIGRGATKDNAAALDNIIAIGATAQATKSNQAILGNASITETILRGNVLIGGIAVGATAAQVVALSNAATEPTTSVNLVHVYGFDRAAGAAALSIYQEAAVEDTGDLAVAKLIPVRWNGVNYKIFAIAA